MDANDEGASGGPKKKAAKKSSVKQISSHEEEEEEGYTQRRIPALSMRYLPVIYRLRCIFRNPDDAQLMSSHASSDRTKDDGKLRHPSDGR